MFVCVQIRRFVYAFSFCIMFFSVRAFCSEPFATPPLDRMDAPFFDRWAIAEYSPELDSVSTGLCLAALALPALDFVVHPLERRSTGIAYVGAAALAFGLKEAGKALIPRYRPYAYTSGYPEEELRNGEYLQSFPSGHTALAFTGATVFALCLGRDGFESGLEIAAAGAGFAAAAGSAALRVSSGSHFPSDVAAGAVLGMISGWAGFALSECIEGMLPEKSGVVPYAAPLSSGFEIGFRIKAPAPR